MHFNPTSFDKIAVGDRIGIKFGNLAEYVTFTHACVVVSRHRDLIRLVPEPLNGFDGRVGGKSYQEWLPAGLDLGRPGLGRRAEWYERGADHLTRLRQDAREAMLAEILRETGHADTGQVDGGEPGEILGSLTQLLERLEGMGFRLPEPVIPGLLPAAQNLGAVGEASALQASLEGTTGPDVVPARARTGPR